MSIKIDFDTVDMRDVETLAMLIDDFMEPDYSKILDIIQENKQFDEFLNYYIEMNGSPFVKRQTLSTATIFCKEFDVEEGWPYLGNKEIDEDDFLPSGCIIVQNAQSSSSVHVKVIKEYSYCDDETGDEMDLDYDTAEDNNEQPQQSSGKLVIDDEFAKVLNRLEKDFPQKSKKIKRISRWAPVILKKPVKVGDGYVRGTNENFNDVNSQAGIMDFRQDTGDSTLVPYDFMEVSELPSPPSAKRKMIDANVSEDEPTLKLKRMRSKSDKVFYEARYLNSKFIIVEDDYRTRRFQEFSYKSHYRAGRFHILSQEQISSSVSYINDIGTIITRGLYEIE